MDFGAYNFSAFAEFIKTASADDTIICTEPFLIEYYGEREPDYMFLSAWHVNSVPDYTSHKDSSGQERDYYAGLRVLKSRDQLTKIERTKATTYIVTNRYFMKSNPVDDEIINYIKSTYTEHPLSNHTFAIYHKRGQQ